MIYKTVHLKELYPVLDRNGADPRLEVMVQEVHKPQYADQKRPSVLLCPGGGYGGTWTGEGQPVAFDYLAAGCNCFVLHYSVKPHVFPQAILEMACAVDYIVTNAEEFCGDPEKTAILGFSAGGHAAASYCTLRNDPEVLKFIPEPKPVQAAILCYPVISAEAPTHIGSFKNLTGKTELTAEDVEHFSLEKHVDPELTPKTFIWAASDDGAVNPVNSMKYAAALGEKKIPYELHIFPSGGHGITTCKHGLVPHPESDAMKHNSVWCNLAVRWLRSVFDF